MAKLLHRAAFAAELAITVLVVHGLVSEQTFSHGWRPLAVLLLALVALACLSLVHVAELFAHRCRRVALQAFALQRDVDARLFAALESEALPGVEFLAKRLPASSLEEYYQPSCPPGPNRLRELYAHSSFYNWRLLRLYGGLAAATGVFLLITGIVLTYALVVQPSESPPESEARLILLDGLYSVVLAFIALRALQKSIAAFVGAGAMRRTHEALLASPLPEGETLQELVLHYEVERARTPLIPALLYRLRRKRLEQRWLDLRAILGCPPAAGMQPAGTAGP